MRARSFHDGLRFDKAAVAKEGEDGCSLRSAMLSKRKLLICSWPSLSHAHPTLCISVSDRKLLSHVSSLPRVFARHPLSSV